MAVSDWALVAVTSAGSLGGVGGAVVTYKMGQRQLDGERARTEAAEKQVLRTVYGSIAATARGFDPRALREGDHSWEQRFYQQIDELELEHDSVRAATEALRGSYEDLKARLVDALIEGETQFNAESIDVVKDWSLAISAFVDAAAHAQGGAS